MVLVWVAGCLRLKEMLVRLVIDLQACETDSRDRGIGRYAMSLVQAVAAALGADDELVIAIDMADTRRARDVRAELRRRKVHADVMAYGYPVTPWTDAAPAARKLAGQLRARFYASLHPDVLLISSLFETEERFTTEIDWQLLGDVPAAVIGYDLIPLVFPDRYLPEGQVRTDWYHTRLQDLARFDRVLSISEATKRDLMSFLTIPEDRIAVIGAGFDPVLADAAGDDARLRALGIEQPFVLMVSNRDWRKNTEGALRAFAHLPAKVRDPYDLVLTQVDADVHQALQYEYSNVRDHVRILGRVDDATLALLYRACRVLYFPSYYEGFGLPVLEAMALDAAVLCSNAGALPEVVHDPQALFDPQSRRDGEALLERALVDDAFREQLRRGAREHALTFTWSQVAEKTLAVLRTLTAEARKRRPRQAAGAPAWLDHDRVQLMADAWMDAGVPGGAALENGLRAIERQGAPRRVLVDISEIVRLDARTGVQRVTRNFFVGLARIAQESGRFSVEPICWVDGQVRYARGYARDKLGVACAGPDVLVRVEPSDFVFMLDSSWSSPERFDDLHARAHAAGGEVVWMVYDLIPIRFPETCDPGMPPAFRTWLTHAARTSDGFVCISEATRHDLEAFMDTVVDVGALRPWTRTAYLGCDLDSASAGAQPSGRATTLRQTLGERPYFVALGTVEPRKDYKSILDAFELLWAGDSDTAIVIVGKQGWNVAEFVTRVQQHPAYGQRLFWLQGLGDADVRYLLEHSQGLIQASLSEGFGLPLVEAGSLGVLLIASDIPVFHEVAGAAAAYFPAGDAQALAAAVARVQAEGKAGAGPLAIRPQSWADASLGLAAVLGVAGR